MPDAGRTSVLIVDDELLVAQTIGRIISRATDCEVVVFAEPEAALRHLEDGSCPDLVISDTNMPGLRGPQFLEQVRRFAPEALCVIMSGYDRGEAQQTVQDGVAHHYLPKPWDGLESVLAFVKEASERRLTRIRRLKSSV